MNYTMRRIISSGLVIFLAFAPAANAGVISTEAAIQMQARQQQLERIGTFLSREEVRQVLVSRGVNPSDASARVHALTDAELAQLAAQIDRLPAGGVGIVEVIGVVAVVLLLLEILGVPMYSPSSNRACGQSGERCGGLSVSCLARACVGVRDNRR